MQIWCLFLFSWNVFLRLFLFLLGLYTVFLTVPNTRFPFTVRAGYYLICLSRFPIRLFISIVFSLFLFLSTLFRYRKNDFITRSEINALNHVIIGSSKTNLWHTKKWEPLHDVRSNFFFFLFDEYKNTWWYLAFWWRDCAKICIAISSGSVVGEAP